MSEKDVLFLCQFFYPEYNSSASLPFDIAQYLANNGLKIDALCGYPKEYNFSGNVPKKEVVENIEIRRLKYIQLNRSKKIARLINYFSFTLTALLHVFSFRKYKSVIVFSNPPILPLVALIANFFFGTKIVFVSFDVYPEVAFASNSLSRTGFVVKFMRFLNHHLFKKVSKVIALTEEMKKYLLDNRPEISENRIEVIPNWAHEDKPVKKPDENVYRKFGFDHNDFIVSYFGNMGVCQDISTFLDAITILKNNSKVKFLVVGHGSKLEKFRETVEDYENVKVFDFLVGEEFEDALAVSSCGVVSLEKGLIGTCAPSKYYSYLQSGLPVLAVVESDLYLAHEVENFNVGKFIELGDSEKLADIIVSLSENTDEFFAMAQNANTIYQCNYSKKIGTEKYRNVFDEVI